MATITLVLGGYFFFVCVSTCKDKFNIWDSFLPALPETRHCRAGQGGNPKG